ncbi:hypothetical protein VNO77_14397 [Canavalia gladiata]|uniref:Uncharacterized protein n=1 Tax=Canavalia gladiata TaxID=3824 RepID=A0AAN9LY64_CANGL
MAAWDVNVGSTLQCLGLESSLLGGIVSISCPTTNGGAALRCKDFLLGSRASSGSVIFPLYAILAGYEPLFCPKHHVGKISSIRMCFRILATSLYWCRIKHDSVSRLAEFSNNHAIGHREFSFQNMLSAMLIQGFSIGPFFLNNSTVLSLVPEFSQKMFYMYALRQDPDAETSRYAH